MTSEWADNNFKILLVDDREENLLSLEEILEQDNRKFVRATSGNEALKLALKHEDIGLIMLDVQMPGMDGFEVAGILKSNPRTAGIAIIFVTAINKEEQYILKGFEQGAVDYLQKPLDINVTRAKVNVFEQLYHSQQELKSTVKEVQRINTQLEQFMHIVAHDIKSPLAGMVTILSVLKEDDCISGNARALQYTGLLHTAATQLATMVNSILDYSKKSASEQRVETVDVRELIDQIAALLLPPPHISIRVAGGMPVFSTQKIKLQQVFQNLISNAIKYNDKPDGIIEVGCREEAQFYCFYVKDNGPGVEDTQIHNIFQLFHTTGAESTRDSSTGIGLNMLQLLVAEQGGKIWVESKKDEGATFFFEWKK